MSSASNSNINKINKGKQKTVNKQKYLENKSRKKNNCIDTSRNKLGNCLWDVLDMAKQGTGVNLTFISKINNNK